MSGHTKKSGKGRKILKILLIILSLILILELGAAFALDRLFLVAGGQLVRRDSTQLDLRGKPLTVAEYEELSAALPGCRILWSVPIGNQRFDSTAGTITLEKADAQTLELLGYFEQLREVNAEGITSAEELEALGRALPGCEIRWAIHLAGSGYDPALATLDLSGTAVTGAELQENLSRFEGLEQVLLNDVDISETERAALESAYPEITFVWGVEAAGKSWLSTEKTLSYAGEAVDVSSLITAADSFYQVEEIDLTGCGLSLEELAAIQEAYSGAFLRSEITLWGQTFTTEETFLDFSGVEMDSTGQVDLLPKLMPNLTKVDMCDCGISNEEMDALNKAHENVQFVWRVEFSVYSLRTDATFFCASDLPSNGYIAIKMTDKQLEPLKYCTELIALDLGHMLYTDLSFLNNMPKLQYLILVEARFHDISPLANLKELKYLEIFVNTIDDLTPLLECKALRHLNIGYTRGFDPEVLKQMTWLERLWYPGHGQDQAVIDEIKAALPDTQCYMPASDTDGSTGNGWREADVYFEMRDIFSMHYMPGGTGTDALN